MAGPGRHLLPDVGQHRLNWDHKHSPVVDRYDRAVAAQMLAALGGLRVANQLRLISADVAGIGLQPRQWGAIGHGQGGALEVGRAQPTSRGHAGQVTQATGVIAATTIDLAGGIGRQVLGKLMPGRRLRTSARTVKRAISKYNARGPDIDRRTYKATLTISVLTGKALTASPDP